MAHSVKLLRIISKHVVKRVSYTQALQLAKILETFRVIGSIELEMCTKLLGNSSAKLGALAALGYSMVRIAHLNGPLWGILAVEPSPVEGQSWQQND